MKEPTNKELNRYVTAAALCIAALVVGISVGADNIQQQVNALKSQVATLQVTVSALKSQLAAVK